MARHPAARRVKREQTQPDDVFVERVLETSVWAQENSRRLIFGTIAVLIVLGTFLWYRNYRVVLRERAETQLSTVRQAVLSGNAALAIHDLEQFLSSYGGTSAAPEARLLLGRAYLENAEPQKAIDLLSSGNVALDRPMGVPTAFLLASAYEAAEQDDQAVAEYMRIASGAPHEYQRQDGLEAAARIRLQTGDPAGALELYDRLIETLPDSDPQKQIIELRRGEAAARAQGTASSGS